MHSRERLRKLFEEDIPFNAHLGMKVLEMGTGEVTLMLERRDEFIGDPRRPALHGGLISILADTAGGLAIFTYIEADQTVSTVDLRVDYLRPGDINHNIYAKSVVMREGNRVGMTQTNVYQDDIQKPIAIATAVYNIVTPKKYFTESP